MEQLSIRDSQPTPHTLYVQIYIISLSYSINFFLPFFFFWSNLFSEIHKCLFAFATGLYLNIYFCRKTMKYLMAFYFNLKSLIKIYIHISKHQFFKSVHVLYTYISIDIHAISAFYTSWIIWFIHVFCEIKIIGIFFFFFSNCIYAVTTCVIQLALADERIAPLTWPRARMKFTTCDELNHNLDTLYIYFYLFPLFFFFFWVGCTLYIHPHALTEGHCTICKA